MRKNKPTGQQKESAGRKRIGRHSISSTRTQPGLMLVAASIGWRSARTATQSRYGASGVLPRISVRWRSG